MTEQELLKLKKQIDEASSKRSELKGQEKAILKQLKDECGAKSIEEAEQAVYEQREAQSEKDLLRQIAAKVLGDSPQNAAGNGSNAADEVSKVFEKYGVSLNDVDAIPLLNLSGARLIDGVASLALKRAKQSSSPSEAASISGTPSGNNDVKELTNQYQKDMLAARGDSQKLKSIKDRARKDGVPVDSIAFV